MFRWSTCVHFMCQLRLLPGSGDLESHDIEALKTRLDELVSLATREDDKYWNTIPFAPDVGDMWKKARFGLLPLPTTDVDGDPSQMATLRVQFH